MIIVKISGGLGNQMFQYALAEKLRHLGKDVKLDITYYDNKNSIREFALTFFPVQFKAASKREIRKYADWSYSLQGKILRKIFGKRKSVYIENLDIEYQPLIYEMENKYLDGYWQNERYFSDIRGELVKQFKFPEKYNEECGEILYKIENSNSISVHIRRGDYLNENNFKIYGNICTLDYYDNAIKYFRKIVSNPMFYIFTNDVEWAKRTFVSKDFEIVECNQNGEEYIYDMMLMSKCKHNIIANSSFSWWAAWLNEHNEKVIAAPEKWFNNHSVSGAICRNWIRISGNKKEECDK